MQVLIILRQFSGIYMNGNFTRTELEVPELAEAVHSVRQVSDQEMISEAFWELDTFNYFGQVLLTGKASR